MSVERIRQPLDAAAAALAEAKEWARVDGDFEDGAFARLIDAAALEAESFAEIALFSQTIRILLPCWPKGHVTLPVHPILDRSSVKLFINTVPWTDFRLSGSTRPLLLMCGNPPPGVIVIEYQAGFGAAVADIPADIRHALLDQVALYYDARGATELPALSPHFTRILQRYRGVRA